MAPGLAAACPEDASSRNPMNAPVRTGPFITVAPLLAVAVLAGCQSEKIATGSSDHPVQFTISNRLAAPVAIAIDGSPQLGLGGGGTAPLTVRASAQWLTWTSAKPMDDQGRPIQDDIQEISIAVSGINRALEITNVIQDRTYITGRFFNGTRNPVSIAVFDGTNVSCAAAMPAMTGDVAGYTQIGYYRLRPETEIRAYRDPRDCTGPFVAWPRESLRTFEAGTGQVTLVLTTAP